MMLFLIVRVLHLAHVLSSQIATLKEANLVDQILILVNQTSNITQINLMSRRKTTMMYLMILLKIVRIQMNLYSQL